MTQDRLTERQEAFARHYALHGNATEAFRAAGYAFGTAKPTTIHRRAIEVRQNGKVAARIEELRQQVEERATRVFDITADRILQELAAIGFANLNDFVQVDDTGHPSFRFDSVERSSWAALGELTIEESEAGGRTVKRTRLKLLDKKGALVELARLTGVFNSKSADQEMASEDDIAAASRDLDARLDQLISRAQAACSEESSQGGKNTWEH
jgi:phage terminase small subunit